ncbi:MAG: M48 family metallopeptidase [Deltaproteobacteria bacterium]|nr:M48 family metallopeptidase [Deltaproteobacteria bacterium]
MRYSNICLVSFLLILGACAPKTKPQDAQLATYRSVQNVVAEYGQVTGQFQNEYLIYIAERLIRALPPQEMGAAQTQIVLLNGAYPMAGTPGPGFLVISRGLVLRLSNEGELAFVVAHEMSHQILGHAISPEQSAEERQELELEADRHAVAMIAVAGYDPRVSVGALLHSAQSGELWEKEPRSPDHPALQERIQAVRAIVLASKWHPPGTIDRYDFQKFKKSLTY